MDNKNLIRGKFLKIFKNPFSLFIVIVLVGTALRLQGLGRHDLWFDEAISDLSSNNLGAKSSDPYLTFYYNFLYFWKSAFGNSEFSLRFPSAISGILSIIFLYKLGKILLDKNTALLASLIFSVSPLHIWYAQEARVYAISVFFVILSAYCFVLALQKNKYFHWIFFALTSGICICLNYFSVYLLFAEGTVFISKQYRHLLKRWSLICAFLLLLILINWDALKMQFLSMEKNLSWWLTKPTLMSILTTFENFNIGYNGTASAYLLSLFLFSILFLYGACHMAKNKKAAFNLLLSSLLIPLFSLFILSKFWRTSFYLDKYLMIFTPFYYLIIAHGIERIKNNHARAGTFLALVFLTGASLINYFADYMPTDPSHHFGIHIKKPFKPAVRYLIDNWRQGDFILHPDSFTQPPFLYYQRKLGFQESEKGQIRYSRIWLISNSWERDGIPSSRSAMAKNKIGERFLHLMGRDFDGIYVDLYAIEKKNPSANMTTPN